MKHRTVSENAVFIEQDYCRIDKKGNILDGPMTLPQQWGKVNGMRALFPEELKELGWYPIMEFENIGPYDKYELVYMPKHDMVQKIRLSDVRTGQLEEGFLPSALRQVKDISERLSTKMFASSVLGTEYLFYNTESEQLYRLNCLAAGVDYECVALLGKEKLVTVKLSAKQLQQLIKEGATSTKKARQQYLKVVVKLQDSSKQDLLDIMDNGVYQYYKDV